MANNTLSRRVLLQALGAGAVCGGVSIGSAAAVHQTWRAHLGPMVAESRGQGNFELKRVRDHMEFGLEAANLTSRVKMAHVHHTADGAPVVWLYSDVPFHPGDTAGNVIQRGDGDAFAADGSFTNEELVGHLDGATLNELVTAIENGNTFVRVHTADHLGGEIQGDLR